MACKDNYIWTGSNYATVAGDDCYILYLGGGRTICDIINSNSTAIPDHIQLFSGEDPEVPSNIRCSDRDLVIRCSDSASIMAVSVCYYDSLARVWRGPYAPEASFTDATKTWFVFKKYLDVVVPFKSEIRLQLAGDITPIDPPAPVAEGVPTTLQVVQPLETFNLALEVAIYNDPAMTDLNTKINTVYPQEDFPVLIFDGTAFKPFPVDGVTETTAGRYAVVDLKALDYNNKVYIQWIWRGIESGAVAGHGAGVYPSNTMTNPDNIGVVWETSM